MKDKRAINNFEHSDSPKKYWLGQFVEAQSINERFHKEAWPLHVTMAGVFTVRAALLTTQLRKCLEAIAPFEVPVTGESEFAVDNRPTSVSLLAPTEPLLSMHNVVVDTLEQYGAEFKKPTFLREQFNPHITKHALFGAAIPGSSITFDQLSLVDLSPQDDSAMRCVVAHFSLGDAL